MLTVSAPTDVCRHVDDVLLGRFTQLYGWPLGVGEHTVTYRSGSPVKGVTAIMTSLFMS